MGEENVQEFAAADSGQLIGFLDHMAADYARVTPEQLHEAFGDLVSPVDVASMTGEFAQYLTDAVKLAVGRGIWGWLDDDLAMLHDWGFSRRDRAAGDDLAGRPTTAWCRSIMALARR